MGINETTFEIILEKLKQANLNTRSKGSMFEKLSKYLLKEKDTASIYKNIYLWDKWEKKDGQDCGIDLIIQTKDDDYIAVQCKFYESSKVDLKDLSTYFSKLQSGVGEIKFSKGIIISTSDLTQNAKKEIEQISKNIPIELITLEDFLNSNISWDKFDPNNSLELPIIAKKKPREHQIQAINNTKEYFANKNNTRGKLIMACGTGKTFTSLKIIEEITPKNSVVLFLAPSIALVGQTFREYCKEKTDDFVASIVCSDSKSGKSIEDDIDILELPIPASTDTQSIKKAYDIAKKDNKRFIIFSTYQSVEKIMQAQKQNDLDEIELIICDEAHRSVGNLYSGKEKDKLNTFTLCHSNENIKAKKRIYMSATPKIYSSSQKNKALENDNEVFSMDDEEIFGNEIYSINFREAVEKGLLTDYKVIILAIKQESIANIANTAIAKLKDEKNVDEKYVDIDFVSKIIGTHKGLARNDLVALDENNKIDNDFLEEMDSNLSRRVINFCKSIRDSKNITNSFKIIMQCYDEALKKDSFKNLNINIDHVDGTMNSNVRLNKLNNLNSPKENTCNILSNARCLSEGVDVPALDSVVFFDGRNSMVDIIQSVGRVMRKAPNKKTGYIILPLALSENELSNLDEAIKNTNFLNIWNILKALRSHDDTLVDEAVFKEKIKIAVADYVGDDNSSNNTDKSYEPSLFDSFTLSELANTLYNAIPTKLGDKGYWQSFSAKTAKIVEKLNIRLNAIFKDHPEILEEFLTSLKENIHPNIKEDEAIDMICSHIITKPIFDVLFDKNMDDNPIGKALDEVNQKLNTFGLDDEETRSLKALYKSVEENVKLAKSQKSKQELIKNLYDTFFRSAFKKQAEKLGIVYTPIQVVDFILHSVNELLKRHFNTDFNDENVKIFDPFTGTGSFITRLLSKENDLISDENFKNKYEKAIFAQDIILLAYYIALINITQTGNERINTLDKFKNIALADSLDYLDKKIQDSGLFALEFKDLEENKKIKDLIANEKIKVIIGNPPYSAGASSENDNNANISHPNLEKRVKDTYGKESNAKLAKNTRDTLIQALRMASDKIEDNGIIGFVVNGGFIDATSADGFRKCVAKEFSDIYILNLRGNARTSGEQRKKEGDGVFDSGSRASVAIVFFVKDTSIKTNKIHYYDIGDYLDRQTKLDKLENFKSIINVPFINIIPNEKGDWINQRGGGFDNLMPLKSNKNEYGIFTINSCGVVTGRDSWVYNFSKEKLANSMQTCIATYNEDLAKFDHQAFLDKNKNIKKSELYKELSDKDITIDNTKISWTGSLKDKIINNKIIDKFNQGNIREISHRPFTKEYLYWEKTWNERQYQLPKLFPKNTDENLLINTTKGDFSALISENIPDYHFIGDTQAFPLYFYQEDGSKEYAISDFALGEFKKQLKDETINKEDIFYYIYAIFHHKSYLEKYKFELSKEAPRIPISKDFKNLSVLGKKLATLHLNYENNEMFKEVEFKDGVLADTDNDEFYKVTKMKKLGNDIFYNQNITIKNIPSKAFEYRINGKSAIDWIIDRYQISIDKKSLIENNPNDYQGSKYIYELLSKIIDLSIKSVDLMDEIGKMEWE
ncbi:DEAD/DEAH box helicase [Campylobacter coli]|uniref:type ISP restriction/modification enzyme n=1 Tax=Campylobacter coli TaxID=195 RepID=UPI0011A20A4C|nr:type ISP restriction/modification enzyme [Campylobacter coli]EII8774772.1 DEAD/DEAH box helicase [Campylobacter coli]